MLRHAKSTWESDAPTDFDRPLSKRGRKAARRMGVWLRAQGLHPDLVVASTALRVRETLHRLLPELDSEPPVAWEEAIYEASLDTLLATLAACPADRQRVLLVGHNPGLAMLVAYLGGVNDPFPTAACAHLTLPEDWSGLDGRCGEVECLVRPRELEL